MKRKPFLIQLRMRQKKVAGFREFLENPTQCVVKVVMIVMRMSAASFLIVLVAILF